ncbi:MAG: PAS domain-containing protein [Hyphomonadaceae bacterium]
MIQLQGLGMSDHLGALRLKGQERVYACWRALRSANGRVRRDRLDLSVIAGELAHVSILAAGPTGFHFRLAGSGLREIFRTDARGRTPTEFGDLCTNKAWMTAPRRTLADGQPQAGVCETDNGDLHLWLRLPLSSDGEHDDLVLCHDRYLPVEALEDLEEAARQADRALRRDLAVAA